MSKLQITSIEKDCVRGGCSFIFLVTELLKANKIMKVNLKKTWKNDKSVFVINGTHYIISDASYIFNYYGKLSFEEFFGKTREINARTIKSSFANPTKYFPTERELALYGSDIDIYSILESYRTLDLSLVSLNV